MAGLFHQFIYLPLYNALVFLIGVVPAEEVGLAVIALTVLVRIVVFPLASRAIRAQVGMRAIAPELEKIKEQYKDNKEEQARNTFEVYKENNISIGAPILFILVQLPLLLGLYWVFLKGGLPIVDPSMLYGFVPVPENPNMDLLGLVNMADRSILLALLAGVTQYFFTRLSMPAPPKEGSGFQHDLAKSMHLQMRYVFPILITVFAYSFSAAVALYWVTGNLFSIAQELWVRRTLKKEQVYEPINNN